MEEHRFIFEQKTQDFIRYFFPIIDRFPKYERYTSVAEMKRCALSIMKNVIIVKHSRYAKDVLRQIDVDLDVLRFLARLSYERGFLPKHSVGVVAERLAELGRMTGGLLNPKPDGRDA